jgi:hypothetical protein
MVENWRHVFLFFFGTSQIEDPTLVTFNGQLKASPTENKLRWSILTGDRSRRMRFCYPGQRRCCQRVRSRETRAEAAPLTLRKEVRGRLCFSKRAPNVVTSKKKKIEEKKRKESMPTRIQ